MKLLITGGMGFIGQAVIRNLLKTKIGRITILDNLSPKIHGRHAKPADFGDKRVKFVKGDVADKNTMRRLLLSADRVLHLAAETGTGQSMYEIELYNRINITATAMMLDILSNNKHGVKKFVIASSRAIYGEGKYRCLKHGSVYPGSRNPSDMKKGDFNVKCPACGRDVRPLPTTEDSCIHPISFYGITKQFQENMVMTLCPNIRISPVALRYQNVYGPGQSLVNPYTGILSIFSNRLRADKDINIFEDGRESRDFVYIDDVAEATKTAILCSKADNRIFNVGSGEPTSVIDVANTLKSLYGSRSRIAISGDFRVGDIRHNFADISLLKKILGFSPRYNLKKGLNLFANWVYLQNVPDNDNYMKSLEEMKNRNLFK